MLHDTKIAWFWQSKDDSVFKVAQLELKNCLLMQTFGNFHCLHSRYLMKSHSLLSSTESAIHGDSAVLVSRDSAPSCLMAVFNSVIKIASCSVLHNSTLCLSRAFTGWLHAPGSMPPGWWLCHILRCCFTRREAHCTGDRSQERCGQTSGCFRRRMCFALISSDNAYTPPLQSSQLLL